MPTRKLIESDKFKGWEVLLTLQDGDVLRSSNFRRPSLTESDKVQDVDMQFLIRWNATSLLPNGEITIKNVKNELAQFFRHGDLMTLQAGWAPDQQNETVALTLAIEDIETEKRSRSRTTFHIQTGDAYFPLLTRGVSMDWPPGTQATDIFRDLVEQAEMKTGKVAPKKEYTYPNGFVVWGPLWHGFRQVAEDTQSIFHYWGNEINLMDRQKGIPSDFTLSPDNGVLVDTPNSVFRPQDELMRALMFNHERPAFRIVSMLTSRIFPNAIYTLRSPELNKGKPLTVRAVRGTYYNDGQSQRVEHDVLAIPEENKRAQVYADARKKAKEANADSS